MSNFLKPFLDKLEHRVFWPPFVLLIVALVFSLIQPEGFEQTVNDVNTWILNHFDWTFNYVSFAMVVLCLAVFFSPLGRVRIGGEHAVPLLNRWRWFSIVLCTSVAVGILFWGSAEPLFHISAPPAALQNSSPEQLNSFAMSTMFMHWSFTPYAIYCVPAILFALAYYNHQREFSLGSMLFPILKNDHHKLNMVVNIICLFALVAGMAASLGAGLLSIAGGIGRFMNTETNGLTLGLIALAVVVTFTVSAASGLLKGIKWLSTINMLIFIALIVFTLSVGPTTEIIKLATAGLSHFVLDFVPHSLSIGEYTDTEWTHSWTTFYWANWMAWAPVTALFLGRLGYGRTVREFMLFNWVLPSVFSIIWMSVFSGTVLHQQAQGANLVQLLQQEGAQSIIYQMIEPFPLTEVIAGIFILTMFISYVTAADSNTMAMSGLSSKDITPDNPEPPAHIKYVWGIVVGLVSWTMVSFSGIEGVKMLSNLGGFPALFLLLFSCVALAVLMIRRHR